MEIFLLSFHCLDSMDYDRGCTIYNVMYEITIYQMMSSQGLLNRWTSQYDWGITAGGLTFNLNNGTKTPLIIVKNLENTFLGMKKVRAWPILTLAMPYVKTVILKNPNSLMRRPSIKKSVI